MTDKQKSEVRATAAALETLDMGGVADLVRRQYAELETLRAGYDAARLEIESLRADLRPGPGSYPVPQPAGEYPALPKSVGDAVDFMDGRAMDVDWSHPAPAGGTSLYSADQMRAYVDADRAMRAAQPAGAQQPGAAYAALTIPDECPHIIFFDDQDMRPAMFAGHGARKAALATFKKISVQWNAHLFVRVEKNSRDDRYPCAAQAAPIAPDVAAELERSDWTPEVYDLMGAMAAGPANDDAMPAAQQPGTAYAPTPDGEPSNVELRGMWHGAGGSFHGPNVETGTMPEYKLLPFLRSLIAQAAPAAVAGSVVNRATVIEWLDANDIEVTDRQMDGLFHFAAPTTQPAHQQEPSYTSVQLAEMVLSDCGHSSNYTPLLERVAVRIDAHVERRLDELRGCLESKPSPASQVDALDAMRYRWLRINAIGAYRTNDGKGPVSVYHLSKIPAIPGIPEETDAAIDAAIAAQEGK